MEYIGSALQPLGRPCLAPPLAALMPHLSLLKINQRFIIILRGSPYNPLEGRPLALTHPLPPLYLWLSLFFPLQNKSRRDGNHSNTFHITHGRQAACLNPPFASAIPLVGYLFHSLKINQGEMDIKKYAPYLRGIFFYILYFL
jgi:hypothetical protein